MLRQAGIVKGMAIDPLYFIKKEKYKKLNLGGKYGYKKTFKQEFEV